MRGKVLSVMGSVGAGIMSMVCCVGPVVLSALGLGGGAFLAQLTPFRPYWIGVSVIMLALGFYLTYRPRKVECEDGTCRIERAGLWNKIAIWSATAAVAVMFALPYALGTLASQDNTASLEKAAPPAARQSASPSQPAPQHPSMETAAKSPEATPSTAPKQPAQAATASVANQEKPAAAQTIATTAPVVAMHQLTLAVQGMTCPACPLTVKNYIYTTPGVTDAKVTLEPPQAVVFYDAVKADANVILASLKEPYKGTVVSDELVSVVLSPAQTPVTAVALHKLTLAVKGMDCPACPLTVKNYIAAVPGVASASVAFETAKAEVVYDAAKTSASQILKNLKEPYSAAILADALAQKQP